MLIIITSEVLEPRGGLGPLCYSQDICLKNQTREWIEVGTASPDSLWTFRKAGKGTLASNCLILLAFSLASTLTASASNLGFVAFSFLCC